nr:MAG TPA: hypothetical protein [Caudoviricetes sp.]
MRARACNGGLTASERKAMHNEIKRQLAEYDRRHAKEIDAIVLWVLRETFGFGEKRLRKYFDEFGRQLNRLIEYYSMGEDDEAWLCSRKLKEAGIDLEKWEAEKWDI